MMRRIRRLEKRVADLEKENAGLKELSARIEIPEIEVMLPGNHSKRIRPGPREARFIKTNTGFVLVFT
jgi:hypothetical protein